MSSKTVRTGRDRLEDAVRGFELRRLAIVLATILVLGAASASASPLDALSYDFEWRMPVTSSATTSATTSADLLDAIAPATFDAAILEPAMLDPEPEPVQPRFPTWQDQQQNAGWSFALTPYVWFAAMDGDQMIDGLEGNQGTDFSDAISDLEFAPGLRVEMTSGQFGFLIDGTLVDISDRDSQKGSRVDVDSELILVDAMMLMRLTQSESFDVALTAGGRYTHADTKVKVRGGSRASDTEDWFDPTIGARVRGPLASGIDFVVRGDYGGFNIGSGDDRSWQVVGELLYDLGGGSRIGVGYRHLVQEYESQSGNSTFEWDQEIAGPTVVLFLGL